MRARFRRIVVILSWVYASAVIIWFILRLWLKDGVWWLALLNSFAPYLFVPVVFILPFCFIYRRRAAWFSLCGPVLIFVWLYGSLFLPVRGNDTASRQTLTVMTFNIWGGSRRTETAEVIIDNGYPDIVALQELTPEMSDVLFEVVGDQYPYHLIEADEAHKGMGVLSRYPLQKVSDDDRLRALDWEVQVIEVNVGGQLITIYNCHPHGSNVLVYLEEGVSIAENVEAGFRKREAIMRHLIDDIERQETPVIVLGDFNSSDQSEVYHILSGRLKNSHREVGWGFGHTFPAYRGSYRGIPILARQMRLDLIFYTEELEALRSEVGDTYGESDHLPVIAELTRR